MKEMGKKEKEGKGKGDSVVEKGGDILNKDEEIGLALHGMTVPERLAKMSVADAVKIEGILPMNPIEVADDKSVENLGRQAGVVYGASIYTLLKALTRDDLPVDKRVQIGMKGVRPLLGMVLQGVDTFNKFSVIEESILYGNASQKEGGVFGRAPSATEVFLEIEKRVHSLEEENKELKKKLKNLPK